MRFPTCFFHTCVAAVLVSASLCLPVTAVAAGAAGFAPALVLDDGGRHYRMQLTGEAERVFLFFRVYEIAHYIEAGGEPLLSPTSVVDDERAKAIVITFSRKLDREQIRDEFNKSMRRNARQEWLDEAEVTVTSFTNAIDRSTRAGDQLIFYWLPGGRVLAEFNGDRSFAVEDPAFAKLIWSIWFGDEPACDRDELIARTVAEAAL